MSAFQCTKTHVGILAKAIAKMAPHATLNGMRVKDGPASAVFACLAEANAKSIDARYPSSIATDPVGPPRLARSILNSESLDYPTRPAIELIKLAKCFEYQSCEFDGWEDSEAAGLIRALIESAILTLPGYDAAPWTAEDPTHTVEEVRA